MLTTVAAVGTFAEHSIMFGKPEWFRDKKIGWGLVPITWQGWTYTAAWGALMAGPFAVLIARTDDVSMGYRLTSAGVWLAATMAGLIWDVWQIKRARNAPPPVVKKKEPVLYIGDEDAKGVSTKNLDLQLRR